MNGYVVVVERDEAGGYSAWSPDLAGCIAASADYAECVQLMSEAIPLHLAGLREDGQAVPEPTAIGTLIVPAA